MSEPGSWEHVAEVVRARRVDLGLSQRAASSLAGLSPTTWVALEGGKRVDALTRCRAARVLGWSADSIDRLLDGAEPVEDPRGVSRAAADRVTALEARMATLEALVRDALAARPRRRRGA